MTILLVFTDRLLTWLAQLLQAMRIDSLPKGRSQPFYHVLVDNRDSRMPGESCLNTSSLHNWLFFADVDVPASMYAPASSCILTVRHRLDLCDYLDFFTLAMLHHTLAVTEVACR